jgi:hypothetical protein
MINGQGYDRRLLLPISEFYSWKNLRKSQKPQQGQLLNLSPNEEGFHSSESKYDIRTATRPKI